MTHILNTIATGEQIRKERQRQGLGQNELAEGLNISQALLRNIEKGIVVPEVEIFMGICERLNVAPQRLLVTNDVPLADGTMDLFEAKIRGERVKKIRQRQGVKRGRLASLVGISTSYLNEIEHGDAEAGFDTMNKICKALSTSMDDIMF